MLFRQQPSRIQRVWRMLTKAQLTDLINLKTQRIKLSAGDGKSEVWKFYQQVSLDGGYCAFRSVCQMSVTVVSH